MTPSSSGGGDGEGGEPGGQANDVNSPEEVHGSGSADDIDGSDSAGEADDPGSAGGPDGSAPDGVDPTVVRPGDDGDDAIGHRAAGVLVESVRRLLRRPQLARPFFVAGLLVALLDLARREDPIPTAHLSGVADTTVHVRFAIYPAGAARTVRTLDALVDLRLPYLLYAVGLELLGIGALAVAGWLVLGRATGVEPRAATLARYAVYLLGVEVLLGVLGSLFGHDVSLPLLLGIVVLSVAAYVLVRLFTVPAALVDGAGLRRALAASDAATYGQRWSVLGVAVVLGLAAWLLGNVPEIGGLLATAVVAPVHAVAVAVVYERGGSPGSNRVGSTESGPGEPFAES